MKTLKLFVVAAIATVAFASCGGGDSDKPVDSTVVADTVAVVADTTAPAPADTTAVADTTKK